MDQLKQCPDCGQAKNIDAFNFNASRPDGRAFYCRPCFAVRSAATYRRKQLARGKTVQERVDLPEGYKRCPSCREVKAHDDWPISRGKRDGLGSECKSCKAARSARDYVWRSYGLAPRDVRRLIAQQLGVCLVCQTAPAVHVDHDHGTGEVRGVLCFNCNVALGQLKDRPDVLRRAADYLEGSVWRTREVSPGVYRLSS